MAEQCVPYKSDLKFTAGITEFVTIRWLNPDGSHLQLGDVTANLIVYKEVDNALATIPATINSSTSELVFEVTGEILQSLTVEGFTRRNYKFYVETTKSVIGQPVETDTLMVGTFKVETATTPDCTDDTEQHDCSCPAQVLQIVERGMQGQSIDFQTMVIPKLEEWFFEHVHNDFIEHKADVQNTIVDIISRVDILEPTIVELFGVGQIEQIAHNKGRVVQVVYYDRQGEYVPISQKTVDSNTIEVSSVMFLDGFLIIS